jgi:hypothetical protein
MLLVKGKIRGKFLLYFLYVEQEFADDFHSMCMTPAGMAAEAGWN